MRITGARVAAGIFLAIAVAIGAWCGGAFRTVISDISVVDLRRVPVASAPVDGRGPRLKLTFTSAVNLGKVVQDEKEGILLDITPCPFNEYELVGGGDVTHNGVDVYDSEKDVAVPASGPPPFTYEVEFSYGPVSYFGAHNTVVDKPMPATPTDLCFKVRAYPRQYGPQGFTSSSVRIPASMIARALGHPR